MTWDVGCPRTRRGNAEEVRELTKQQLEISEPQVHNKYPTEWWKINIKQTAILYINNWPTDDVLPIVYDSEFCLELWSKYSPKSKNIHIYGWM